MKPWNIDDIPFDIDDIPFDIERTKLLFRNFNLIDNSNQTIKDKLNQNLNEIIKLKKSTGIMIYNLCNEKNQIIYIFLFDDTILIILEEDIYHLHDFFDKNKELLLFLTKQTEDDFLYFLSNNKFLPTKKECISNNKIYLQITRCIIKKSQYRTLKSHYSSSNQFIINTYNSNDFIKIHKFISDNLISLCYNVKDQLLYISKINKIDENYNHEIKFYNTIKNQYPYITKFFGYDEDKNIVIEYIQGQTLYNYIVKNRGKLNYPTKIKLILQILFAVEYVHSKKIFLRDLKLDNIIVNSVYNDAILIDFNLSKLTEDDNQEMTANIGSTLFSAPEKNSTNNYNEKVDIYSIGMIIHFILTEIPYDSKIFSLDYLCKLQQFNINILDRDEFPKCPNEYLFCQKLYKKCFEISPSLRPNISELINDFILNIELENYLKINDAHYNDIESILFKFVTLRLNTFEFMIDEHQKINLNSFINIYEIIYFCGMIYITGKFIKQDIQKYIRYITIASDHNITKAQSLLGSLYYSGHFVQKNINKSIDLLKKAAEKNEINAIINLGTIFYKNNDIKQSIHYFTLAAEQNNALAQYNIGVIYLFNESNFKNIEKGINYLKLSADQNHPESQIILCNIYFEGKLIKKNIEKAFYYLNCAIKQKYRRAYFMLGKMYYEGIYVVQNYKIAVDYLSEAAKLNDPEAQFYLGDIMLSNEEIRQNIGQPIYYLVLSANQNFQMTIDLLSFMFNLASIFQPIFDQIPRKNINNIYQNLEFYDEKNKIIISFLRNIRYIVSIIENNQNNSSLQLLLGQIFYDGKIIHQDIKKAIHYFTLSANQNNSSAQCFLGKIYYFDFKFILQDIKKAIHYLTLSACQNNSDAQYLLGRIYYRNEFGIKRDINKSIHFLTLSADQKHMHAQFLLGKIYYEGIYVKKDFEKSIHYLKHSSLQNNQNAQYLLGKIYYDDKNINKAIYYFSLSANQNNSDAQFLLGEIFYSGQFIIKDIPKAMHYFQSSANQNNPKAQLILGYIYYEGKYISRDIKKALYYLELSSNQKFSEAQFYFGYIYYIGKHIQKNINKSIKLFILASNQNHCVAQYLLGNIYLEGKYVKRNIIEGIKYLTLSANQNYSKAQYSLGKIYFSGKYIPRDINNSIKYLEFASEKVSDAFFMLGCIFFDQEFEKHDILKAINYFKEAHNYNCLQATNNLGIIYKNGEAQKNIFWAIDYFEKAIKKGNDLYSLCNLAKIYYFGIDVDRDVEKAISLLEKASNQDFLLADIFLFFIFIDYDGKKDKIQSMNYLIRIKDVYNINLLDIIIPIFKPNVSYDDFFDIPLKNFFVQYDYIYKININNADIYSIDIFNVNDPVDDFFYFIENKTFKKNKNENKVIKRILSKPINKDFYDGFYDNCNK